MNLKSLSDRELVRCLSESVKQSRRVEADVVAQIGEMDERRLYARKATPSMFAYCTEVLHLSEPEAALRIRAARASRKHPALLAMLRDGQIHLSGIALLAPVLTRANRDALLKKATHQSKRQIQQILAELAPRPDVPASMRKLPVRSGGPRAVAPVQRPDAVEAPGSTGAPAAAQGALRTGTAPGSSSEQRPDAVAGRGRGTLWDDGGEAARTDEQRPDAVGQPPARRAVVEPLGANRYKVKFTASADFHDKLQRLQALRRETVPDGDLGKVIELAVTRDLERLEAKRLGKTRTPRKTLAETDTTPKSRNVPAPVRRAVWKRDGGQCTYRDERGRRCRARERLEFHHHSTPYGKGGDHSPATVRVMCHTHNILQAELDYGAEKMAQYRRRRPANGRVSEPAAVYSASRRTADHATV